MWNIYKFPPQTERKIKLFLFIILWSFGLSSYTLYTLAYIGGCKQYEYEVWNENQTSTICISCPSWLQPEEVCDGHKIYPPSIDLECIFCPKETFPKKDNSQSCLPCRLSLNLIEKLPCLPDQNHECGDGCILDIIGHIIPFRARNAIGVCFLLICLFILWTSVKIAHLLIIAHKSKPYLPTV